MAPPPSRLGLYLGLGIGLLILLGVAGGIAMFARNVLATAPMSPPNVPTAVLPSGAPVPQPMKAGGDVQIMVMSDDPDVQQALLKDETLTPKVEACVASVRAKKQASIVLVFEVSSAGMKPIMTQATPMGPHVPCVTNAIGNRKLETTKKKASLQVVISWS